MNIKSKNRSPRMHLELTPVQGYTGVAPYQFVQGKLLPSEGLPVEHTVSKL